MEDCVNKASPFGLTWGNIKVSVDGKAVSRGIGIGVGTPQQIVALTPSLGDENTWLVNAADCINAANSSCVGNKGGVYNTTLSSSFVLTTQTSWNGSIQIYEFGSDSNVFFNDNLHLGENGTIPGFPLIMDKPGYGTSSGLGISENSTFLNGIVQSGLAPSKVFGMWAGSRSFAYPVDGALWIGGYDTSRVNGSFTTFPSLPYCTMCAKVTNLTYTNKKGTSSLFSNSSQSLDVGLESYQRGLQVPPDIFANFLRVAGATVGTDPGTTGLGVVPTSADLGSLTVTFANGYQTTIPSQELFLPPRSFNQDGVYSITNNTYFVSGIQNVTSAPIFVPSWGIPILTMNYVIIDYANQTFKLAPAVQGTYELDNHALIEPLCKGAAAVNATSGMPSDTPSGPSNSSSASTSGDHGKTTSGGVVAGAVVAGVFGLILLATIGFFIRRRNRRAKAKANAQRQDDNTIGVHELKSSEIYQAPTNTQISEADSKNTGYRLLPRKDSKLAKSQAIAKNEKPIEMPTN